MFISLQAKRVITSGMDSIDDFAENRDGAFDNVFDEFNSLSAIYGERSINFVEQRPPFNTVAVSRPRAAMSNADEHVRPAVFPSWIYCSGLMNLADTASPPARTDLLLSCTTPCNPYRRHQGEGNVRLHPVVLRVHCHPAMLCLFQAVFLTCWSFWPIPFVIIFTGYASGTNFTRAEHREPA